LARIRQVLDQLRRDDQVEFRVSKIFGFEVLSIGDHEVLEPTVITKPFQGRLVEVAAPELVRTFGQPRMEKPSRRELGVEVGASIRTADVKYAVIRRQPGEEIVLIGDVADVREPQGALLPAVSDLTTSRTTRRTNSVFVRM
jgi:hypothetical protein